MKLMRNVLTAVMLLVSGLMSVPAMAGFLQFPLHCSDASCTINYATHGAYTADAIISVLDHQMKLNTTNYYPYGVYSGGGGDKVVTAFNGESKNGTPLASDETCVGGTIYIHPDWDPTKRMTNNAGCGANYSSYDEHPGYDYKAATGTTVYAAAAGYVVANRCYIGNNGYTCAGWGAVGIDHGNGYISQYFHMNPSSITVTAGSYVSAGQPIGTTSNTCPTPTCVAHPLGPHLHFEVRHNGPTIGAETKPIVDPYGWVGGGSGDPLYSAPYVTPQNLWQ